MTDDAAVPFVTMAELRAQLRDPAVTLLDVLSRESYAAAHLPGAVNIPVDELAGRADDELPDRSASIITYCGSDT